MPRSHNKKRNVGIIYELLLRRVSECLVNEDNSEAQKTLDIISRRFKKGTVLYREFRLFRALAKSHVSSLEAARSILAEAKIAARDTDLKNLEKEKSDLIREINHGLKDKKMYFRYIPDYKSLATIQVLLNDWRDGFDADLQRMSLYETKVAEYLLEEKKDSSVESNEVKEVDPLVIKIMSEKINEKYQDKFNKDQQDILKAYAFSSLNESSADRRNLEELLAKTSEASLKRINLLSEKTDNKIILEKISIVREKILTENSKPLSDQKVVRFLTLVDLCREIEESL